jgi:hypothetical protein
MTRTSVADQSRSAHVMTPPGSRIGRSRVAGWVGGLRDRLTPTVYMDRHAIPDDAPSPCRARLALPAEQSPTGTEVQGREVVRGEITLIYQVRCACGKRWFNPRLENLPLCPRCGRPVPLEAPGP